MAAAHDAAGEKHAAIAWYRRYLKVGKDPSKLKGADRPASPYVVPEGYRGVQDKIVSPGTHYLNPYVASLE